MDIIQIFKEASTALQQDPRYIALAEIRKRNDADEKLEQLIKDFTETKSVLSAELEKQVRDNDLVVDLNAKANSLYGELMSYPGIVAYNKAKLEVDRMVAYIDSILTTALQGGDPMTVQEPKNESKEMPCSGNCSSCGSSCR